MTWDQLRADLARALDAHFPDEASEILAGIERRVPAGDAVPLGGLGATKKVFLRDLAAAVGDCFPERGNRILHKLQRVLEPPEARGEVTRCVSVAVTASSGGAPMLVVATGPLLGRSLVLNRDHFLIGRSPVCDLVIHDEDFSRRHLEVLVEDGVVSISDQRSTNGTSVNRVPIPPLTDVILRDGDHIRAANTILLFRTSSLRFFERPT